MGGRGKSVQAGVSYQASLITNMNTDPAPQVQAETTELLKNLCVLLGFLNIKHEHGPCTTGSS